MLTIQQPRRWILGLFALACLALPACGMELGWPEPASSSQKKSESKKKLRIFVSKATTNGKIGSGGIGQADSLCEQDENSPSTGIFRAMLSDGASRIAVPNGQKAWVLDASRTYTRVDGTEIGTTTSQAVFAFPLKAAIDAVAVPVWTGISSGTWATGLHCEAWTKDTVGANAVFGYSDRLNSEFLAGGTSSCDTARHLYCVEQPGLEEEQ